MLQKVKDFFTNNGTIIKVALFGALGGAIICYCILVFYPKNPNIYNNWQEQYNATQHKLDSATTVTVSLRKQIDSLQKRDLSVVKEEKKLDQKIPVINKQKDEKISIIDRYNADSLEQFFTERYDTSN